MWIWTLIVATDRYPIRFYFRESIQVSHTQQLIHDVIKKFHFSARVYHKLLKVARTIADLEGAEGIDLLHVQETLQFRSLDKFKNYLVHK